MEHFFFKSNWHAQHWVRTRPVLIKYGSEQGRTTAVAHAETPPSPLSPPGRPPCSPHPRPGWVEVPGEGRPGRACADVGCAWPILARRLSHEPRARSSPPPPGWAVNEALPATWGASSAWCPGRQSRLSARPAGGRQGLRCP